MMIQEKMSDEDLQRLAKRIYADVRKDEAKYLAEAEAEYQAMHRRNEYARKNYGASSGLSACAGSTDSGSCSSCGGSCS